MEEPLEQLKAVVEREHAKLLSYACKRVKSSSDAADMVSEAVIRALDYVRRNPGYRPSCWEAWLRRILANVIKDNYRLRLRKNGVPVSLAEPIKDRGTRAEGITLAYDSDTPDNTGIRELAVSQDYMQDIEHKELSSTIDDIINHYLSPNQRAAIILFYYYNCTRLEIAEKMFPEAEARKAAGRVGSLLNRARIRLRQLVADSEFCHRHFANSYA